MTHGSNVSFYYINMFILTPIIEAALDKSLDALDAFKLLRTFLEMCCVTSFSVIVRNILYIWKNYYKYQ